MQCTKWATLKDHHKQRLKQKAQEYANTFCETNWWVDTSAWVSNILGQSCKSRPGEFIILYSYMCFQEKGEIIPANDSVFQPWQVTPYNI